MQNHCFRALGTQKMFSLWSTSKITEEMLAFLRSDEFGGSAVTMPLKTAIIPFLDELSSETKLTNACNTIVKVPTGDGKFKLVGQNTDILGIRNALLSALREQHPSRFIPSDASATFPAVSTDGASAGLVIGGGATTRFAAHALTLLGLSPIFLVNRDVGEVRAVMDAMPHLSKRGGIIHLRDPAGVEKYLVGPGKAKLLVIVGCIPSFAPQTYEERMVHTTVSAVLTTPYIVPTTPSTVLPYPTRRLFLEMPYKPLHTTMYQVAAAHGWHVIDGIEAMIEQGYAQQRMFARGEATMSVGSDPTILGPEIEQSARRDTRTRLLLPQTPEELEAIKNEVDRAHGEEAAAPPWK
uniref:Pentafunctional arom polypeptide n=1 Tax=Mycena chlorophos TaxID=658473 RepID=A0ABQ0L717_MYCCL|nr:pentafunctional arom polypeptide [Mycena chlorophos]